MFDTIIRFGESIIQHGKYNDRIYLMKLSENDYPEILDKLDNMALQNQYSKILAKIPPIAKNEFVKNGYVIEAEIPGFYSGDNNVFFVSKYFTDERKIDTKNWENKNILETALSKSGNGLNPCIDERFRYRICNRFHIHQMGDIYKKVFKTYPFPIYDIGYLEKTMDDNVIYFGIWEENKIVALSSSEMDIEHLNVEMTDFAILPDYRGNNISDYLLDKMEKEMIKKGLKTAYTISRAGSYGINILFAKSGYKYGGTLINNTNISGGLESMNVWYKHL